MYPGISGHIGIGNCTTSLKGGARRLHLCRRRRARRGPVRRARQRVQCSRGANSARDTVATMLGLNRAQLLGFVLVSLAILRFVLQVDSQTTFVDLQSEAAPATSVALPRAAASSRQGGVPTPTSSLVLPADELTPVLTRRPPPAAHALSASSAPPPPPPPPPLASGAASGSSAGGSSGGLVPCAPGCETHGVCNGELGRCDCPPLREGPACERSAVPSCREQWGLQLPYAPCQVWTKDQDYYTDFPPTCECLAECHALNFRTEYARDVRL